MAHAIIEVRAMAGAASHPAARGPAVLTAALPLLDLIDEIGRRFAAARATVATYTPSKDDGSRLAVAVAAIERLLAATRPQA